MKIRVKTNKLSKALKKIAPICSSRVLPIANNILIKTYENGIEITGTNASSLSIKANIECEVIEEGSATFPANKITQVVETFNDDLTELSEGLVVCGKLIVKLESINAKHFPKDLFRIRESAAFNLKSDVLIKGLKKTLDTTAQLEDKGLLSGIHIYSDNTNLIFESTDGNVASKYIEAAISLENFNIVLPSFSTKEILKTLSDNEDLKLECCEQYLKINNGEIEITTALLDGKFPNIEHFFNRESENGFTIDKYYFNSVLKRCQVLRTNAKDELTILWLALSGNRLDFSFKDVLNETTIVENHGEDIKIGLNVANLPIIAKNIEADELRFGLKDSLSAVIFEDEAYTLLIMPCRGKG